MNYNNSWKNKEVFKQQLDLNKKELLQYPPLWQEFV